MTEPIARASRTCTVSFDTEDGLVKAVDGVSFDIAKGETLGIVGESGSGKSVANLSILGPDPGRQRDDRRPDHVRAARTCNALTDEQLREIRGNEIAMIFQDPLTSLHPFYKVGKQMVEAIQVHQRPARARPRRRAPSSCSGWSGSPTPERRSASIRTSSRAACASAR